MIYVPNLPHVTKPVSVGWHFSTVMLLPEQPSSWVDILEQRRISTEQTAIEVGIARLQAVLPVISRPVIVRACRELGCSALIHILCNRNLYRAAPPRQPKQCGAPHKHGSLFQRKRPETHGPADAVWEGTDEQGKRVVVSYLEALALTNFSKGLLKLPKTVHIPLRNLQRTNHKPLFATQSLL